MSQHVKALVLCAGKGTRLQTEGVDLPKVMRLADGKPLLHYVLSALDFLPKEDVILVVGYKKEAVLAAYGDYPSAVQAQQLWLYLCGNVLILGNVFNCVRYRRKKEKNIQKNS